MRALSHAKGLVTGLRPPGTPNSCRHTTRCVALDEGGDYVVSFVSRSFDAASSCGAGRRGLSVL